MLGSLNKMIDTRLGHEITPEFWQQCEDGANMYKFALSALQGFVSVSASLGLLSD